MSLSENNRQKLCDLIHSWLPIENDGTIHLTSRSL
jgi:hypothetical protein